jgi:hypothetical protein
MQVPKEPVADLWELARPHIFAEAALIATCVSRHHKNRTCSRS